MHILRSSVYEIVAAACKESHFNDEFTGCSKAEIVAYFRLLDHRQESVLDVESVLEHIEHFQHRVSKYSFLLDFIRYHVKSMALDNAINANKARQQQAHAQAEQQKQQWGQPAHEPNVRQNHAKPTHVKQAVQPQHAPSRQRNNTHTTYSAPIDDGSNIVSYSDSMHEERVSNNYDSDQPMYGDMSHAEDYGVEADAHHMDMGYMEDGDYF
jgi:hypothetical protein